MSYIPNDLNELETYVYNIKISMVSPVNFSKEKFIAENSTDSTLNISSVTHTLVLGQSLVRSAYVNQFDIIIHEPNNVRFFEKIVRSAGELNIQNHINATYKIEISFPGRTHNGSPSTYPKTKPFTYYVKFLKVDANITERGAEYIIQAVETNSKAYSYINGDIKTTLTYTASSVNEALTGFEDVLNQAANIHNETNLNSLNPDQYKILLADDTQDWGNWKIEINEKTQNVEGDKLLFHITSGTKIAEHISTILKSTREYKEHPLVRGGTAKPLDQEVSDEGSIGMKYLYKVIPVIRELEFDPLRGDYTKEITYIIKRHIVPEMLLDSSDLQKSVSDRSYQLALLKEYFDTGLLKKKYDYLYTGKNTEVIQFDMKLQYAYYLISPVFGGQVSFSNLQYSREISDQVKSVQSKKSRYVQARRNVDAAFDEAGGINSQTERAADDFFKARDDYTLSATELWDNVQNTPLPNFQSDVVDNSYSYVSENNEQAVALARFGSVQANVETSPDLLEIELGIRGDPYWLGNPTGDAEFSENSAPYTIGGPMFFLNINLPVSEDSSGLRKPSTEYYISGVYKVINVISEFRNGEFIQYLKAIRMVKVLTDVVSDNLQKGEVSGPVATLSPSTTYGEPSAEPITQPNRNGPISERTSSTPSGNVQDPAVTQERQREQANPSVGTQATQKDKIDLDATNVIGIFGKPPNTKALIIDADKKTKNVSVGETYKGDKVTSITDTTVTFESGNTLEMPPG